ncbi:MAG TPA: PqqD family peptide modification chaperone [Gemmatimonadaceae bacterium]|nr:PqqD family peptide modification chaperone [Gemmatimonadaceae bacterium]
MSVTNLPTVDVVLAVRNEARRIGESIESLLAQDYPQALVKIFVADNGSDDETVEVASRYAVTVVREHKPGSAAARNNAIRSSKADLIAFFDGHCIANKSWISSMCTRFEDQRVGGAQARIENTATDSRVIAYLESSSMNSYDHVLEDTVYGTHNVYPWILSGNCMFRRDIVERVGGFDEQLPACEDVDLSWKVVLSGYLLVNCPDASVVHWNDDDWQKFVKKSWRQGRGSAVLAKRYLPHGASNAFQPSMIWHKGRDRSMVALKYWGGYRYEAARIVAGRSKAARNEKLPRVAAETRPPFTWIDRQRMSISGDAVYWFRGESVSIIVHNPSRSRIVLDQSADLIWRQIAKGASREQTVQLLISKYRITRCDAEIDLDEFVDELAKSGVVVIDRS